MNLASSIRRVWISCSVSSVTGGGVPVCLCVCVWVCVCMCVGLSHLMGGVFVCVSVCHLYVLT